MVILVDITFSHAYKSFDDKRVLLDFSWTLPNCPALVIQGRSGSGKTTLLRLLAGLEQIDAGSITGLPKRVSFMFQENRLLPWYTIRRNIEILGVSAADADGWLDSVGLSKDADRMPGELSGGMSRRAAFARALAFPAPVLLLDEPFKELDGITKTDMIALALGQFESRERIIVVTHDAAEATALGGCIVWFDGPPLKIERN